MSENNKDLHEVAELRPLRSMLADADLAADARLLGESLQQLHDAEMPALPPPNWSAVEERALKLARRRRWRYHLVEAWRGLGTWQLAAGAAAAALILILGTLGARSLSISRTDSHVATERAHDAPAADLRDKLELSSAVEARKVTLRCGAQLELADGQASIEQREAKRPSIHLLRGRVTVQVPPMGSGGRLVVATSDAEVIVHGTRFVVNRRDPEDATIVSVQEGLVEVRPIGGRRSAVFLRAGEQTVVLSTAAYTRQLRAQVGELVDGGRCDDQASRTLDAYLDIAPTGTDVSGALYLQGSCAALKGDLAAALTAFEKVASAANSELRADNALARIAQLRAGSSRTDGATAWRRYLERFPQGTHRESAQRYLRELQVRKSD